MRVENYAKGVAVCVGFGQSGSADRTRGAAAVVDDELLTRLHRQLLREDTRYLVDGATGREDGDDLDGFGGPCLRGRARGETGDEHKSKRCQTGAHEFHRLRPSNGCFLRVERSTPSRQRTFTA